MDPRNDDVRFLTSGLFIRLKYIPKLAKGDSMKSILLPIFSASSLIAVSLLSSCAPGAYNAGANPPSGNTGRLQAATPAEAKPKYPELTYGKKYPKGFPLMKDGKVVKNRVISPYRPYNVLNVSGMRSGAVVGDPYTRKKDQKTGKRVDASAKLFRLP